MADELKVHHLHFDPEKYMVRSGVVSKQTKPKPVEGNPSAPPQQISYQQLNLQYAYTVKDKEGRDVQAVGPLMMEGPEMEAIGISEKPALSGGGINASLFTKLSVTDPEVATFVSTDPEKPGAIERLYKYCLGQLFEQRIAVQAFQRIITREALEAVFAYPIHWQRSNQTGQIIAGSSPSKFWPLICYGQEGTPGRKETSFTYPIKEGKDGPWLREKWGVVRESKIRFRPLISCDHVYIGGGKASLQIKVVSVVLLDIVPANKITKQEGTLEAYSGDAKLIEELKRKLELLNVGKDEKDGGAGEAGKKEGLAPPPSAGGIPLPAPPPPQGVAPAPLFGLPPSLPPPLQQQLAAPAPSFSIPGLPSLPPQLPMTPLPSLPPPPAQGHQNLQAILTGS